MNNLFLEALIVTGYHLVLSGYWRTRSDHCGHVRVDWPEPPKIETDRDSVAHHLGGIKLSLTRHGFADYGDDGAPGHRGCASRKGHRSIHRGQSQASSYSPTQLAAIFSERCQASLDVECDSRRTYRMRRFILQIY
jgi:hypothetical protein